MKILWLDIETTGLDPKDSQILSIGAIYGQREFQCFIKHEQLNGSLDSILMNHQTLLRCREEGNKYWIEQLYNFINATDAEFIGGHGVAFDVDHLSKRVGCLMGRTWIVGNKRFKHHYIDTAILGYAVYREVLSLKELCQRLDIKYGEHDSLGDARSAKQCEEALCKILHT